MKRAFERGDVEHHHAEHGFRCTPGAVAVRVGHQFAEHARHDLPGETPAVLEPAALLRLAAMVEERVPDAVDLLLTVAFDLDRKCMIE